MSKQISSSLPEMAFGVCTSCFSILSGLTFLGSVVRPSSGMLFQWMGLLLPLLLLVNMALLILWIVRRRAWFFFPLMALIANYSYYPTIFQIRFGDTSRQDTLSPIVMGTYNVRSFRMDYGGSSLMNIAELIQEKKVNILCLQEVPSDLDRQSLAKAFSFLPYRVYTDSADTGFNVLILTKFPVKKYSTISFAERPNCALVADLDIDGKLVRVFNCHLQTTNWNQRHAFRSGNLLEESIDKVEMEQKIIENNFEKRSFQADSISRLVEASTLPVIVCGDFNDTPASYAYHRLKGNLTDSFRSCGYGYAYTYRYMHKLFRIDYVFYPSEMFVGDKYESPDVAFSDHNPVIVGLGFKN